MQTWLSYHIYPLETPEVFLKRALRPFLEQKVWPVKGARAFFIRFEDEKGPHIRVRLRGDEDFMEIIPSIFKEYFEGRGEIIETAYLPEPERFGGSEALAWAEEYFHQSTRVVLDCMDKDTYLYGDAMFDALKLHVITVFSIGLKPPKAAWYFEQLFEQWLPVFFKPLDETQSTDWKKDLLTSFENGFKPQRKELIKELDKLWKMLEAGKLDKNQPEYLRWLRANEFILKEMGGNLEKALPSLIHLTNNRIGINNQDEVYACFILSKVFAPF